MNELDPDGHRLFLELSANLYEQAIGRIDGDQPRNEGLAFWEAIRAAMDAEAEQHKRRMMVFRMLEDLAVYRMAKVQGMPYDRIGARAGQRSRSWAFQHTMPQDLVDGLLDLYAKAEQEERDAFITATTQAEPVDAPSSEVVTVIPINSHAKRSAREAARRSILYRQLRRFLGGAAAVAGPVCAAMKTAAENYTSTMQTALMSNGALTPMPGLDPLSSGGLSGMLSASVTATSSSTAGAQAAGPVATAVGKVVASAVIGVQATAGVSAPAAVAVATAAGTPVVMVVEGAAQPIVAALGLDKPGPAPAPDLAALPTAPPSGDDPLPYLQVEMPTARSTTKPASTPTPEPSTTPPHPAPTTVVIASTAAVTPAVTASAAKTAPASTPRATATRTVSPVDPALTVQPSTSPTSVPNAAATEPQTEGATSPPTPAPTSTVTATDPVPSSQPTGTPTSPPTTPASTPTSTPTSSEPQPSPTWVPTKEPDQGPAQVPTQAPVPTPSSEPRPSGNPPYPGPAPVGDGQAPSGGAVGSTAVPLALAPGPGGIQGWRHLHPWQYLAVTRRA